MVFLWYYKHELAVLTKYKYKTWGSFVFLYFVAWAVELLSKYKRVTQNLWPSTEASVLVFSRFFFARKAQLRKWKRRKDWAQDTEKLKLHAEVMVLLFSHLLKVFTGFIFFAHKAQFWKWQDQTRHFSENSFCSSHSSHFLN